MNFQEIADKLKTGTFLLDDNNNWEDQEIEIDDLLTAVTESCSKIQEKEKMGKAGPSNVGEKIVEPKMKNV
jgi:Arc/MetJ family transcription regulator